MRVFLISRIHEERVLPLVRRSESPLSRSKMKSPSSRYAFHRGSPSRTSSCLLYVYSFMIHTLPTPSLGSNVQAGICPVPYPPAV
ncbi:hypothetical protein BDZ89DRAFT_693188 [Hymenopellis radicata]|nr:hypothetical protein BDZ89DRAFT_693188 [Hymenopellis radicata]